MPKDKGGSKTVKGKTALSKKVPVLGTTYEETYNIVAAIIVASLIFAYNWEYPEQSFVMFPQALVAVLIAYAVHLPVQKLIARRLGCVAFYRLWLPGAIFSVFLMVVGIKIVLVGTVFVAAYNFSRWGMKSRDTSMTEVGWVGISGPIANILVGTVFKLLPGFSYLANVNLLIALFNLLPVKPLDGGKVFLWDPVYWAVLFFILFLIITPSGLLGYITALYAV